MTRSERRPIGHWEVLFTGPHSPSRNRELVIAVVVQKWK